MVDGKTPRHRGMAGRFLIRLEGFIASKLAMAALRIQAECRTMST